MKRSLGYHVLADLFDCDRRRIDDRDFVRASMLEAARRARATIVTDVFHTFNPHGLSGVVVIAESHLAIHTWPEHGCVAIDVFSCSDDMDPKAAIDHLIEAFHSTHHVIERKERGVAAPPDRPGATSM